MNVSPLPIRFVAAGLLLAPQHPVSGQIFQELHAFAGGADGLVPEGALVEGRDGNFYGTTFWGGSFATNDPTGFGTVFKMTPEGALTTLVSFNGINGKFPRGVLTEGSDSNFYGVTANGGANNVGTVFKITSDGALTTLVSFTGVNGVYPWGGLVQGTDSNFYGATQEGGASYVDTRNRGYGSIFKMTPAGTLTTLLSFRIERYEEGLWPTDGLTLASDGNFYGTTAGGRAGHGTAFRVTPAGALTTLVVFDHPLVSVDPAAGLVQAQDGNFYGTTTAGGPNGTIFRMTPGGAVTVLGRFNYANGANPVAPVIQGSDGNFYGTTQDGGAGHGTVFQMTPDGQLTTLVSFTGNSGAYPGATPRAGLVEGTDGNLYGTCATRGTLGHGNIFRIVMGPKLSFANSGNQLMLSWPTNYPGFTLQSAPTVNSTTWTAIAEAPVIVSGKYVVTTSFAGSARFFRLTK